MGAHAWTAMASRCRRPRRTVPASIVRGPISDLSPQPGACLVAQGVLDRAGGAQHGQSLQVAGDKAFLLYDSYGFPLEITAEMAADAGVGVDEAGFEKAMDEQRRRSKDAAKVVTTILHSAFGHGICTHSGGQRSR